MDRIMDLVSVLAEHGVTGKALHAATLEAQKQEVIYASVWAAGNGAYHQGERARARVAIRKMFPGTVLRSTWEPVEEELGDEPRERMATTHQGANGRGPYWWYNASEYPGAEAAAAWFLQRAAEDKARAERVCECGTMGCQDLAPYCENHQTHHY